MRLFVRPRSSAHRRYHTTDELVVVGQHDDEDEAAAAPVHHIHTMSLENPFLPTDDDMDDDNDDGQGSDVSSVSNDSFKRYQNWVPPPPGRSLPVEMMTPFVPPQEIVIIIKKRSDSPVPDWLRTPCLRHPSLHGPPASAFVHALASHDHHPLLTSSSITSSSCSDRQQQRSSLPPSSSSKRPYRFHVGTGHARNMSWGTETTLSSSSLNFGAPASPLGSAPPVLVGDRPRRREQRGSPHAYSVGDFGGQSGFLVATTTTTTPQQDCVSAPSTVSSSLSFSGDSFAHTRRANRKLDELVGGAGNLEELHHQPPRNNVRRNSPLKEEVLYVFDMFSAPVKRMANNIHRRGKSDYDLQASAHGCLA